MKYKYGFTLVEILVVVVIISMIAGIAVVAYNTQQKLGRDNNLEAGAMQLATALDDYYAEHGGYPVTCDIGSSTLLACDNLNTTYTSSMSTPPTITASTTTSGLISILPRLSSSFSHPKSDANTLINQQAGGVIARTSYFLLSMDMVPGADTTVITPPSDPCPPLSVCGPPDVTGDTGVTLASQSNIKVLAASTTPASATINFQNPAGGTLSCGFELSGKNPTGSEDIRPHQYVIGFVSEAENAWKFFLSTASADKNVLNWNNSANPSCEALSTEDLKRLSSS